ncbi:MAG: hypothetical protein Q4D03_04555 [Bacteroidales bacterium]|nr:hypothetical protein [Bacteroidales bacterium]
MESQQPKEQSNPNSNNEQEKSERVALVKLELLLRAIKQAEENENQQD